MPSLKKASAGEAIDIRGLAEVFDYLDYSEYDYSNGKGK
jgi:hypothetical protein